MKYQFKKEILSVLDSLQNAEGNLKFENREHVHQLTINMQEAAILIGTELEKQLTDDDIVKLLEAYCELLYQINCESENKKRWNILLGQLKGKFKEIRRSIEALQTDKIEIVFLPYNASMWDALDSVYREAVKEEQCHVSVVPIPYYSKDDKGEFTVMNYEGENFPEDIPIVHYNKYSLAKQCPDVIFIHNPYDQYNNLTRISSNYYTSELIKYTDHLVYIPYYVADKNTSEIQCFMPGIKNAWRVYVQSDYIKQQMIAYNEQNKINVSGSPKIDMVVNMAKNPPKIPNDWYDALSGRKVFLVATTLVSMLNRPENVINKINEIIDFVEGKDEYGIIFRPHPLTEKVVKEENCIRYQELLERLTKLKNVVLDCSSDNHRAIALSDAYIGERSSMLTLYKASGKPMYVMNWTDDQLNNEVRTISMLWAGIQNENIWMFHHKINALFCFDKNTGATQYVCSVESEPKYQEALYREIFHYYDKMFLVANSARNNVLVDKKSMIQIEIPCIRKPNIHGVKNASACQEKNKVYLFPKFYGDNIVVFDFDTNSSEEIIIDYNLLKDKNINSTQSVWANGWKTDDGFYLATLQIPEILFIDKDGKQQFYEFKTRNQGFVDGKLFENKLYLLPYLGSDIVEFDIKTKKSECIDLGKEIFKHNNTDGYVRIMRVKNKLYLIPYTEDKLIIFDMDGKTMKHYDIGENRYLDCKISDDKIYVFPIKGEEMLVIDVETDCISNLKIYMPSNQYGKVFYEYWVHEIPDEGGDAHIYGEEVCGLAQFVDAVVNDTVDYHQKIRKEAERFVGKTDGHSGRRIWKDILEYI